MVVAALAPVILSRFDLAGHGLWLACSLLALVLLLVIWIVNYRTAEMQEEIAGTSRAQLVGQGFATALIMVLLIGALILVVLGVFPDQEAALYLAAVALGLFMGAFTLLWLVFSQRRPQTVSDPAALPATGGSSV